MKQLSFGEIINRERKKRGLSLKGLSDKLSDKLSINPSYLHRLESGEKENPGFRIIFNLCKEMELDMREVFRSLGFESLLDDANEESSLEQLIRTTNTHLLLNDQYPYHLNAHEKEAFINFLYAGFSYSVSDSEINQLDHVLKQLYNLKQTVTSKKIFDAQFGPVSLRIDCQAVPLEGETFETFKKILIEDLETEAHKLTDYQDNLFVMTLSAEKWFVKKVGSHLTLISKATKLIPYN